MLSFIFLKAYNLNFIKISNSFFHFLFFFNPQKSIFFLFCLKMSNKFVIYNLSTFFFLIFPFFLKRNLNIVRNSILTSISNINFFIKQRLRLSGLGYFVEPTAESLKIHVGLTKAPEFLVPNCIYSFKVNRKKKKTFIERLCFISFKKLLFLITFG